MQIHSWGIEGHVHIQESPEQPLSPLADLETWFKQT